MSIHQSRSSILALFDNLILFADGYCMRNGPAGKACVDYFSKLGYPCPEYFNPADYFRFRC